MSRKLKLIWDFKGPDGLETAKHHCIHLEEFSQIDNLVCHEITFKVLNPMHTIAFVIINESDMKIFRDTLKPHRGELA
ncbi:hypothetical protein [Tenacibaculum aestuariivivum]|uniref:hypothetical protein n=1 Tax=Tenacibaculum aestuariivivum TaxID=2006131 RepID=UPI003AB13685